MTITALVPASLAEAEAMAARLAQSSLVPDAFRGKAADTFLAIAYGMELGIPPVSSLRSIAVIKGKPTLYADAMVGLVMSSGLAIYFSRVETEADIATYETQRRGAPKPQRMSFSLDEAKAAGLTSSDGWKKYPAAMLRARAKAFLARDVYPDLLHGIYSAEEMDGITEPAVATVVGTDYAAPPRVVDTVEALPPPDRQAIGMRLLEASTLVELDAAIADVRAEIDRLDDEGKKELRALTVAHKARLTVSEAQR